MPRIATNLINFARPGLWVRVRAASDDGGLAGLKGRDADLERHGLHRDQAFVSSLHGWYEERVPVQAAFSLWFLRSIQDTDGCVCRSRAEPVVETNPVLRFIHLALAVGEDTSSDQAVERAAAWVVAHQLPDGSLPSTPSDRSGEIGTTARGARALDGVGAGYDEAAEAMRASLARDARTIDGGTAWGAGTGRRQAAPAAGPR